MSDTVPATTEAVAALNVTETTAPAAAAPAAAAKKAAPAKVKKGALKVPKGTQDFSPEQMTVREALFGKITTCFKRHGAVTIETPVFELRDTLTGKYVAMNRIRAIKRYHIARVYRRDNPVMTKGRFREFYQCDFDIAGEYDLMVPDAECIKIICEILDAVNVGSYLIKLNHRRLLDAIFALCGVPEDNFRAICSAVDKLDKISWAEVRKEMVEVKHLDGAVADRIETFVRLAGKPFEMLAKIRAEGLCNASPDALAVLDQLEVLFGYLEVMGVVNHVSFDLSLARGLDYYTGIIFEAVITDSDRGSIAAGGRYDGLVGMYGNLQVPSVGFSIGIERIFSIIEEINAKNKVKVRQNSTQVYVVQMEKADMLKDRLAVCTMLWNAGISTEFTYKTAPAARKQMDNADENQVPLLILLGKSEIETNTLTVKNMAARTQVVIEREGFVEKIKEMLEQLASNPVAAAPVATATTTTTTN
eukprot:gene7553-8835_t